MNNLYEILGLQINASHYDIKNAYHKLIKIYHPDKNKSIEAHDKFIQIHSAYEILINTSIIKEYDTLDAAERMCFLELIKKIYKNDLNISDIYTYFKKINYTDFNYLKDNFINLCQSINIIELFNLFKNGIINKTNIITFSDTENDNEMYRQYYYILPLYLNINNSLDIKLIINVTLDDILNNIIKKIKIIRRINNQNITSTFIFNITHPYVVFFLGGDVYENNNGNVIIELCLPENLYWNDNIIYYNYPINLYNMIYGIDINLYDKLLINKWIGIKDGMIIKKNINNINIIINLILKFNHTQINHDILYNNFNN